MKSKFRFNDAGDVINTSYLSIDLLQIAQVLSITRQLTWKQILLNDTNDPPFDDSNLYEFLKSLKGLHDETHVKIDALAVSLAAL